MTTSTTNATTVLHSHIFNTTTGININGRSNSIIGCNIGGMIEDGIGINIVDSTNSLANYIVGNYIESPAVNVTGIRVNAEGNTIEGNFFHLTDPDADSINIESGQARGNTIISNYNLQPGGVGNPNAPIPNQFNSNIDINGEFALNPVEDEVSAHQNAYSGADGYSTVLMKSTINPVEIRGIVNGFNGRFLRIINIGVTNGIKLMDDSGFANPSDQLALGGADITLVPFQSALFYYDSEDANKWRLINDVTGV